MPLVQIRMLIPLHLAVAMGDLYKPNPSLEKTPRHQALTSKILSHRIVQSIESQGRLGLGLQILNFRQTRLHPKRQLVSSQLPSDRSLVWIGLREVLVHLGQQVQLLSLRSSIETRMNNMLHRSLLGRLTRIANRCPLAIRRQECRPPIVHPSVR